MAEENNRLVKCLEALDTLDERYGEKAKRIAGALIAAALILFVLLIVYLSKLL